MGQPNVDHLRVVHREIEERAREIAAVSGGWPCHKGCDRCCRRLADVPRLTGAERDLLSEGVAHLPAEVRRQVEERVREMAHAVPPIVCPFLDRDAGACLVYDCRPVACRTYGFYVERDSGLYCGTIREMAEAGRCEAVVWGNACAVEVKLDMLDPKTARSPLSG